MPRGVLDVGKPAQQEHLGCILGGLNPLEDEGVQALEAGSMKVNLRGVICTNMQLNYVSVQVVP